MPILDGCLTQFIIIIVLVVVVVVSLYINVLSAVSIVHHLPTISTETSRGQ